MRSIGPLNSRVTTTPGGSREVASQKGSRMTAKTAPQGRGSRRWVRSSFGAGRESRTSRAAAMSSRSGVAPAGPV